MILWHVIFFNWFVYFNWRLTTLQYSGGFCQTLTWISYSMNQTQLHVSTILTPPSTSPHPVPQGHPSAPVLSTLSHASNLDQRSTSHMIIHTFQRYPLKSSHPHLPQSPKDCSLHLCLFCCLAYRVIVTIFLNSIYMAYKLYHYKLHQKKRWMNEWNSFRRSILWSKWKIRLQQRRVNRTPY